MDPHLGPFARSRSDTELVSQVLAGFMGEVEAHAGRPGVHSPVGAGVKGLKDAGQVLRGDADAIVGHREDQLVLAPLKADAHPPFPVRPAGVLHRVGDDLLEDELQPLGIAFDP